MSKIILLFPPGCCLNTGSPHLSLPLLKGALEERVSATVQIRDMNWEVGEFYNVRIGIAEAVKSTQFNTLDAFNKPYFRSEDKLMRIAKVYNGEWNIQLGFSHNTLSCYSSRDIYEALHHNSPFTEYFKKVIVPSVNNEDPDLIGFSLCSKFQIIPTLHLCWLLRKAGYDKLIILGGNIISRLKQELINIPWLFCLVNGLFVFQGELPLTTFVGALTSGRNFDDVPNLIWSNKERVIENRLIEFQNPNEFPPPNFEGLPIGEYCGINYLPLLASRGCYHGKCSFCSIPYGYGNNGFSGVREARLVFNDILTLEQRYGIHRYKFMDESIPPAILMQLSDLILRERIQIEWEGFVRLENCWLNSRFVNSFRSSGFKKAAFGLEIYPGSERNVMQKNDRADQVLEILKICYNAGVKVHFFCMFGFPGTSVKKAQETVDFILKYRHLIDTVDLNPYKYAKHTKVTGVEKIIKPGDDLALEYEFEADNKEGLSSEQIERLTNSLEDTIWQECPRLLHPTYRLISPWSFPRMAQKSKEKGFVLAAYH